jgi:nitrate/TMAO reductase-like tetraheme cytochrome c subunit
MNKRNIILISLFASSVIFGCSQLYVPSLADTVKQKELLRGRELYVNHCSGCHNLHLPKEYNADQWKKNIDEMQEKAKISDEDKQLILHYLTSEH